jgi:hypothetical protein
MNSLQTKNFMINTYPKEAWQITVAMLRGSHCISPTVVLPAVCQTRLKGDLARTGIVGGPSVKILERLTPRTINVTWSDPQSGHYGSQIWRMATAKRAGVCIVSGVTIARGALIFKPSQRNHATANVDFMICANSGHTGLD